MNRRKFLAATGGLAATGLGVSALGASSAFAATDDDYAFANFGLPAEWLLQEIHTQTIAAKLGTKAQLKASRQARSFAGPARNGSHRSPAGRSPDGAGA